MTDDLKRLKRLRDSAENLGDQLDRSSNVPLDQYINPTDINGLRDTFGIDPEKVTVDDLSRIILVRDALYAIVEQTNDMEEGSEHSIRQLIHSLNQVYVDTESYLKSKSPLVKAANAALDAQAHTPQVPITPEGAIGQTVINVTSEVINNVSHTEKHIHINILNGIKVDVLRNLRVQIRRLSASAFAINVKVNAQVLFEGTVQFLTAAADRVLSDLRAMAETLKESFGSAEALVKSLDSVIKSGTKFVRVVGSLIRDALHDDPSYTEVKMTLRNAGRSRVITCGATLADGTAALCGRNGSLYIMATSGHFTPQSTGYSGHIHAVEPMPDGRLAMGTTDGLIAWTPKHRGGGSEFSRSREKIVALAAHRHDQNDTILAGTSVAGIDRWWFPGGRPEHFLVPSHETSVAIEQWDAKKRLGHIHGIEILEDKIAVAGDHNVLILRPDLEMERDFPIHPQINSMCRVSDSEVVLVGEGLVAVLGVGHGYHIRMLQVPADAEYVSATMLRENLIAVCDAKGTVLAIDLKSGAEVGKIETEMHSRGLLTVGKFLVVYGGDWNKEERSTAIVLWEEKVTTPAV